jgi:hypothetical protein
MDLLKRSPPGTTFRSNGSLALTTILRRRYPVSAVTFIIRMLPQMFAPSSNGKGPRPPIPAPRTGRQMHCEFERLESFNLIIFRKTYPASTVVRNNHLLKCHRSPGLSSSSHPCRFRHSEVSNRWANEVRAAQRLCLRAPDPLLHEIDLSALDCSSVAAVIRACGSLHG